MADYASLPLVLLHGFPFNASIWDEVTDFAFDAFDQPVLAPNLPGFGGTVPPTEFSMDALARWLHGWLVTHPDSGDGRVVLAGHSMGGYVALAFAARYPELVAGLVLVHSTSAADTPERREKRDEQIQFLETHGAARLLPQFIYPLVAPQNAESLALPLALLENQAAQVPVETLVGYLRAMRDRPDQSRVLRSATFPVMLLWGTHDPVLSASAVRAQHELIRGRKPWHELTNSGHLGMLEEPVVTGGMICALADEAAAAEAGRG